MSDLRRWFAAFAVVSLPLTGCGIILGSQGAAQQAVSDLGTKEEAPDAPNPLVETPRSRDVHKRPGQQETTTTQATSNGKGKGTTTVPITVPSTTTTLDVSPFITVPPRFDPPKKPVAPTYPDTLLGRIARMQADDKYWEEFRHKTKGGPTGQPLTAFCTDLGAFTEAGNQLNYVMLARPDLGNLRGAVATLVVSMRDLGKYVPDQLPQVFVDGRTAMEAATPLINAAPTVTDAGNIIGQVFGQYSLPIQRVLEQHQEDCPNLHHY